MARERSSESFFFPVRCSRRTMTRASRNQVLLANQFLNSRLCRARTPAFVHRGRGTLSCFKGVPLRVLSDVRYAAAYGLVHRSRHFTFVTDALLLRELLEPSFWWISPWVTTRRRVASRWLSLFEIISRCASPEAIFFIAHLTLIVNTIIWSLIALWSRI